MSLLSASLERRIKRGEEWVERFQLQWIEFLFLGHTGLYDDGVIRVNISEMVLIDKDEIVGKLISGNGGSCDRIEDVVSFCILHEIGHRVHRASVDEEEWNALMELCCWEVAKNLPQEEYLNLPTEKYANDFAAKHFEKVRYGDFSELYSELKKYEHVGWW